MKSTLATRIYWGCIYAICAVSVPVAGYLLVLQTVKGLCYGYLPPELLPFALKMLPLALLLSIWQSWFETIYAAENEPSQSVQSSDGR